MKFLTAILFAGLCMFSACSDDDDNGKDETFSNLKPEQHKENIAKEGEAIVEKLGAVAELETYKVVDAFMDLMDGNDTKSSSVVTFGLDEIISVKNVKSSVNGTSTYKIAEGFKEQTGIYEFDELTKEFKKSKESATVITYLFKVGDEDAEISVTNFKSKAVSIKDEKSGNIEADLPLELNMHIKLGSTILSDFVLVAEWNADNTPKSITETFSLEGFSFNSELTNTTSTLAINTSFKHEAFTIYATEIKVDGNFDYEAILKTADNTSDMNDLLGQEIVDKGNVSFQLGDIKAEGIVDANGFLKAMEAKFEANEKVENAVIVELLNQYAKLYVKYSSSDEIVAKGEFYLDAYKENAVTYTEPSLRMIFSDGSAVSESFFSAGFSGMLNDINELIKEMNKNYDLELDSID